jgi:lysine 2,3-aminomutase
MRERVTGEETLARLVRLTDDERSAIEATRGVFRWSITPYYASLMDPDDPSCPVRRQVVPSMSEVAPDIVGVADPLEEVAHSPVRSVIHNYRDRVAFCVTTECAIYCRYCLRKRMVGDAEQMMSRRELQEGIDYIAAHPEIRDVLVTGGDPLTYGDRMLDWLLGALRAIGHVEIIRIGTRMPVKLPFRIDDALCEVLSRHHPVWVNAHFNHPKELTPDAAASIDRLLRAGVPVGNQTVLLKGINDDADTLKALFEGLVRMRVRPYYLYQAQLIGGTAAFRTSIERGMRLMESLRGRTTGFAIPVYVLDTPFGKVPLDRSWVLGRSGDHVIMRTARGETWAEPNPLPADEAHEQGHLPQVSMPRGARTLRTGAEARGGSWVVPA